MTHRPVDAGDGTCRECGRLVAAYAGALQHRRGRVAGVAQGKRPPRVASPKCRRCRSAVRPLRIFRLFTEQTLVAPSRAIIRKAAGTTLLCEPCWRELVDARVAA